MRARLIILGLALAATVAIPPAVGDPEPFVTLVEETQGRAFVPTSPYLGSPLADSFAFTVDACHRQLVIDLLYDPAELALDVPDVGSAALAYEFRVEAWHNGSLVLAERVAHSGYGTPIGLVSEAGDHTLRLSLAWGADVSYTLRLRGALLTQEPGCNPPL